MLANELGWLSVDGMLDSMTRREFNERWALAVLEARESRRTRDVPQRREDTGGDWMRAMAGL